MESNKDSKGLALSRHMSLLHGCIGWTGSIEPGDIYLVGDDNQYQQEVAKRAAVLVRPYIRISKV
jgi:hypothetical protein